MMRRLALAALIFCLCHAGALAQTTVMGKFQQHTVHIYFSGYDASCKFADTTDIYQMSSAMIPINKTCNGANITAQIYLQFPDTIQGTQPHYTLLLNPAITTDIKATGRWNTPDANYTGWAELSDQIYTQGCPDDNTDVPRQNLPAGSSSFLLDRPCQLSRLVALDGDKVNTYTLYSTLVIDATRKGSSEGQYSIDIKTEYLFGAPPAVLPQLSIDHVEVVQAVQTAKNEIPLVAGKKTAVRAFAKVPDGSDPLIGVTGLLHGLRNNVELPGSPLQSANGLITASPHPQRDNPNDSLIFVLPPEWTTAGDTQMVAEIAPASGTDTSANTPSMPLTATFAAPANLPSPFIVYYWPLCYQPPGADLLCPTDAISHADVWLRKMYPLAEDNVIYSRWMVPFKIWHKPLNTRQDVQKFLEVARKMYDLVDSIAWDQLVAWFPFGTAGNIAGMSDPVWSDPNGENRVVFAQDSSPVDVLRPAKTLAHEIGHNLGLHHTSTADSCGANDDHLPADHWRYPDVYIHEVGMDPFTLEVKEDNLKMDLMSYCTPMSELWISAYDYQHLMSSRVLPQAHSIQPLDALNGPSNQVVISGSAQADASSGTLDPAFVVGSSAPIGAPDPSGNHCLRFFNAGGPESDYCFTLYFEDPSTLEPLDREFFALHVPYPADTTRIALVRNGNELASLTVNQDAPQVAVTAPQSGDQWSGVQTLYWTASDPAGNALTYSVLYSGDGGQTWTPMEVDLQSPQYTFDTGQITAGSQVYFRVLATSGVTTGSATVGPITIAPAANLVATPANLDFGGLTAGGQADLTVSLSNTGNTPVTVTPGSDLAAPFGLLGPGAPFVVAPGASYKLTIRFSPGASGTTSGSLTLYTDNPAQPTLTLATSGQAANAGDPRLAISPPALAFGSLSFKQVGELKLAVRNSGGATLQVTSFSSSDAQFAVVSPAAPLTIPAGGSASLTIHFTAVSPGQQNARLTLAANDPLQSSASIALSGVGAFPRALIGPQRLDFGAVAPGQTKDLAVTIANGGAANLTVLSIASSAAGFAASGAATPFSLAPGTSQAVTVRFAPTASGAQTGTLKIASDDPANPTMSVALAGQTPDPGPAPATIRSSDTFNRPDAGPNALGTTDLGLGGTLTYCYIPIFSGAAIVSKTLQNNGTGYGGVQFGQPGSGGSCSFRGQDIGQNLNLVVDLLVPSDAAGNSATAGPYFHNRGAAAADGILGGDSGGYWVQLDSSGRVKVVDAHTATAIAISDQPAGFDNTIFHTLEVAVSGTTLQATLDRALVTFTQGSGTTNTVSIPTTGGSNDGTGGVAFALVSGSGRIGGASADNLIVTQYRALSAN
jgi:hypothetical protein